MFYFIKIIWLKNFNDIFSSHQRFIVEGVEDLNGVRWDQEVNRYRAQRLINGKSCFGGFFNTPRKAASAADDLLRRFSSEFEFRRLNFPTDEEIKIQKTSIDGLIRTKKAKVTIKLVDDLQKCEARRQLLECKFAHCTQTKRRLLNRDSISEPPPKVIKCINNKMFVKI